MLKKKQKGKKSKRKKNKKAEPRLPEYPPLRLLWFFPWPRETAPQFEEDDDWSPAPQSASDDAEHEIYHQLVGAIRTRVAAVATAASADQALAELDAYLPLAAYMEVESAYSDREVAPELFRLEPSVDLAHTLRTLPDICRIVFDLKFWSRDCPNDWSTLLTKATPLPCKGRNLELSFAEAAEHSTVFDFELRVLFGCFLGLYGGRKAALRKRIALYSAFQVFPPSVKQLQRFLLANKSVASLCFESFNLFSMQQGVFDDFLRETYKWDVICQNRQDAVLCLQENVDALIDKFGFQFMNLSRAPVAKAWTELAPKLKEFSVDFKKFCFRPVTQSLTSCVVSQAFKIWRKHSDEKRYAGLLEIPMDYFRHVWSIPYDPSNQGEFDGALSLLPKGLFSEEICARWKVVRHWYYMERTMTGPQHFMAGTEKKRTGLYFTDRECFFDIFKFSLAVENRRKIRWAPLPREWALRQANALVIPGTDGIAPDAGVYFICPNCCKTRCLPVTFPNGMFKDKRERARYSHETRIDLGTMEVACKDFSRRRKEQIVKRRRRKNKDCDNIRVCSDTQLIRFCMIGMVLWTEQDGNLMLCVDCGTLISWTPECYTDRGPTCGCALQAPLPQELGSCKHCKRKFSSRTKFRTHTVLNELTGELEDIKICNRHGTGWELKLPYIFTERQLIRSIVYEQYAFLLHGTTPIFTDKR